MPVDQSFEVKIEFLDRGEPDDSRSCRNCLRSMRLTHVCVSYENTMEMQQWYSCVCGIAEDRHAS